MKIETLHDAFVQELCDIYDAETQLTKALPKMADAATDSMLTTAFESHLSETEGQIDILKRVFEVCEIKQSKEKCEAMEGLVKEGEQVIKDIKEGAVRDAMLIAAAQKVEHYEIASYGTLIAIAGKLGFAEAAAMFEEILDQEKSADDKLNTLAEQSINSKALQEAA